MSRDLPVGATLVFQEQELIVCAAIVDTPGKDSCKGCHFNGYAEHCHKAPRCSKPNRIFMSIADAVAFKLTGELPK